MARHLAEGYQFHRSLELFDLILELDPPNTGVLFNQALTLSKHGMVVEADKAYNSLMELVPWDSSIVNNYGLHLLGAGRTLDGIHMLNKAVEIDGCVDALENLGSYYYYAKGDNERAKQYFSKVLGSSPKRAKSLILHELIKINGFPGRD
jgi:Tfp pilus assembly protein PilF